MPKAARRIQAVLKYKRFAAMIDANPLDKKAAEFNSDKLKDFVLFTEKTEKKFFGLLNQLAKILDKSFIRDITRYKDDLFDYTDMISMDMAELESNSDDYKHK